MNPNRQMLAAFALLTAAGLAPAQQILPRTPAQAQSPAQPPQPAAKPALNLRLDEIERRPAIKFGPKDDSKKQDAALPGLGGSPSKSWGGNPDPSTVVPPTNPTIQ